MPLSNSPTKFKNQKIRFSSLKFQTSFLEIPLNIPFCVLRAPPSSFRIIHFSRVSKKFVLSWEVVKRNKQYSQSIYRLEKIFSRSWKNAALTLRDSLITNQLQLLRVTLSIFAIRDIVNCFNKKVFQKFDLFLRLIWLFSRNQIFWTLSIEFFPQALLSPQSILAKSPLSVP